MHSPEDRPRPGRSGSVRSRAADVALKTFAAIAGVVVLAGALVLSLAIFAFALVAIAVFGGYLWWKTRELRRHMAAARENPPTAERRADVIEGVVTSKRWSEIDREP